MLIPTLLFLIVTSQQCDLLSVEKSIQISSGGAVITIEQNETDYLIHYMTNETLSFFSSPFETKLDLTYVDGFQVNLKNVSLIAGDGNVTLSPILQNFLKPINSSELLQVCFDFSFERLILKICVGLLSGLVILSNGQLTKNTTQSLLRSLKSRRISRTGRTLSRSQESFTTRYQESSIWIYFNSRKLHKTSSIPSSETLS